MVRGAVRGAGVLVTGATGFVGSYLLCALLAGAPGVRFVCLVRADSDDDARGRLLRVLRATGDAWREVRARPGTHGAQVCAGMLCRG